MILVATDGSAQAEAATRVACELASQLGDELILVTAWRELQAGLVPLSVVIPDAAEIEHDWAEETVAKAAAIASRAGVGATTITRHGLAGEQICRVAEKMRPRMIVMGSRGWGPVGGALFGSVSTYVVHHAPCPVLVVGDAAAHPAGVERSDALARA